MTTIAALLTVHNRKEKTLLCLERLYAQQMPEEVALSTYLVDDGCTDGTAEAVREQFPEVNIIHGDGNLFWNRGMYKAWEAAAKDKDFDFYLWLNDDTILYENAMESLFLSSAKENDRAVVVGTTESTAGDRLTYGGRNAKGEIINPTGSRIVADFFNGNIVLVPSYVYHILGNLDYYFRHSKGDFDYGMRAKEAGIDIIVANGILGACDSHPTLDAWCNPDVPLKKRWAMLHRPNGMPPAETFHLEARHNNILVASFHYLTVHLRCLFPRLWSFKQKI